MSYPFDSSYCTEPFRTLCSEFPNTEGYPQSRFRVEWGPIFHRGRLDGSARILVIGQDPAQHEAVVRRILVGEAGRRVQGFLSKVGITKSYVMINAFLYSVYGSVRTENRRNVQLVAYRNRWLDALLLNNNQIEGVVALGKYATEAWQMWKDTPSGKDLDIAFCTVTHPTYPESFSKGDRTKLIESTKRMLQNWNKGLQSLAEAITHPDEHKPLALYGETFTDGEKPEIPLIDYPAGLPAWMRKLDGWARRVGNTEEKKRRNITITIPKQYLPP